MKRKLVFLAVILVVLVGALALLAPLADWSAALEEAILRLEPGVALAAFCGISVLGSLLLLPAWIFPVVAGAVFGFGWGVVAALVSTALSVVAAFLLARHVLHGLVDRAARRQPAFQALNEAVTKEPRKIVALVRLSPVLPSAMKSYFFGLTRVNLADYALASLAGMLPGLLLKVYVGAAGRDALADGGVLAWAIFGAGAAATLALALIVGRAVRRRLAL